MFTKYIKPAVDEGLSSFQVRAGDVHAELGLLSRMPTVCSSLDGKKFSEQFNVALVDRKGPSKGANVFYTFRILEGRREVPVFLDQPSKPITKTKIVPRKISAYENKGICLVSCVGKKRSEAARAKDLYQSDWFLKARCFVESKGYRWFILSAEHGLVDPNAVVAPYDKTLNVMAVRDRRDWADKVLGELLALDSGSFIFLAGQRYREFLTGPLLSRGITVEVPMEGLKIGQQLSWLLEHTPK